jgi:ribonuclease HII
MLCFKENAIEAGVDEVGRGPGLGRLYTAAVVWPVDLKSLLVKDSKTIKKQHLKASYEFVKMNAVAYAIDYATEEEIAKEGILQANINSMHRSLNELNLKLTLKLNHVLVDGNYFQDYKDLTGNKVRHTTVIKGDSIYYSIAAASILAKYTRDLYIEDLCLKYPELNSKYKILSNKGYLSKDHMEGLQKHGYCQFHRKTWKPFENMAFNPVNSKKIPLIIKKKDLNFKPLNHCTGH